MNNSPMEWTTEEQRQIEDRASAEIYGVLTTFGITNLTLRWEDTPLLVNVNSRKYDSKGNAYKVTVSEAVEETLDKKEKQTGSRLPPKMYQHSKNTLGMKLLDKLYPPSMGFFYYPAIIEGVPHLVSSLDEEKEPMAIDDREMSLKCKEWLYQNGISTICTYRGENSTLTMSTFGDLKLDLGGVVFVGGVEPTLVFSAINWVIDNTEIAVELREAFA